jgi:hypothetical protein
VTHWRWLPQTGVSIGPAFGEAKGYCGCVAVATFASQFSVSHDYAHLRASLLSGAPGGRYHALATRLAARAKQEHGRLIVVPTAGSVENIAHLVEDQTRCVAAFALVQDGIPVPADAGLALLGRQSGARVPAASRTTGPQVSHLRRSTEIVDRNRSRRLGDCISHAAAL